jgi:DNA helicase-2/ATP-dependent DNA helicase PcrA
MLNDNQKKAAEHGDGALLILAGPGSGKTRVLVHRIARLVGSGLAFPSEILAVTFTNKAASEMKSRVEALAGSQARDIAIGTFHSVCLKILRSHAEKAGLGERFVIYDESDQLALVKECMRVLDIDSARVKPNSVVERISRCKDACVSPEAFEAEAGANPYLKAISRIYARYQKRLAELAAVDFGDIIMLAVKLFSDHRDVLDAYRKRWRFVHVDEYQDTNHAQYKFIRLLVEGHGNICVVGDDDQSIYRWRGADISNILRFEEDFPGAAVIRLEQNYRSSGYIVSASESVIANNAGRKGKALWTSNASGEKVRVDAFDSEAIEAERIALEIKRAADSGRALRDNAIFYRTNAQSRPLEDAFRRHQIPYRIFGGLKFYERMEIKDVIAYLRLAADARDDVSFRRVVNVPARGIGKTTISHLEAFAAASGHGFLESVGAFVESSASGRKALSKLSEFASIVAELSKSERGDLGKFVRDVLEKTGYIEALVSQATIEAEARLENINELVTAMEEFEPIGADPLTEFLDSVSLVSDVDGMDESSGAVTMMTAHLAKGLEFPCVFMVGMEEGLFPHARSLCDPEELEEERRLCYVGMTRAKERLVMSHAFKRRIFGTERYSVSSRFLDEISPDSVERGPPGYASARVVREGKPRMFERHGFGTAPAHADLEFDQRPPEERAPRYAAGQRVVHPSFGSGVVKSCELTSMGHRVTVRFDGGMIKKLIAEFANLK